MQLPTQPVKQRLAGVLLAGTLLFASCSTDATLDSASSTTSADTSALTTSTSTTGTTSTGTTSTNPDATLVSTVASSVFDTSLVHELAIDVDPADIESAINAYLASGDKEWIEVTVTIDGITYEQVGLRLKGNSSLRGVSTDAAPETLPWLIRFDKYIDDQTHLGYADLVIRSNTSETSLNEAVALDLLDAAGLASQQAVHTALSFNGGSSELRLMIEHPDDVWMALTLSTEGALYKAESTGDYSYRGDDPDLYDEVFDQEAGKDNTDLDPLIEFLDFINNADDATFENELADHLDIDAFATYLAMMDLVDNFDDIDGPGNNSYLYYDSATDSFTVVPWDLNLAFGATNGGAGGGGVDGPAVGGPAVDGPAVDGGDPATGPGRDADFERPATAGGLGVQPGAQAGVQPGGQPGNVGGPGGSNILVERFQAAAEFAALYDTALVELQAELFDSGVAAELLADRIAVLTGEDTIDAAVLASEAAALGSLMA